jgi:hypothetical protein
MRGQRALRDSQAASPEGSEDDEARSPVSNDGNDRDTLTITLTPPIGFARGRTGKSAKSDAQDPNPKRDALDVMH